MAAAMSSGKAVREQDSRRKLELGNVISTLCSVLFHHTEQWKSDLSPNVLHDFIMPICYAFGCNNRQIRKDKRSLPFHRFSTKKACIVKTTAIKIQQRCNFWEKSSSLCSEHFEGDCFEEDLHAKYVGRSPGKRARGSLKTNAVLTIFKKCFAKHVVMERKQCDGRES